MPTTTVSSLIAAQLGGAGATLDEYLIDHSNLPGPAANLTLAWAVSDELARLHQAGQAEVWSLLERWAAISVDDAPVNTPGEFLPAIAAIAWGDVAARAPDRWAPALDHLHMQASDPRWRTRECVAMGLQRMARARFDDVYSVLLAWVEENEWLVMRAAVATLAEPDVLRDEVRARQALALVESVVSRFAAASATARKTAEFEALRKGLGYAISVVGAALPAPTFDLMRLWAEQAQSDRDLRWVLVQNLKKNRLVRRYPREVAALLEALGSR